MGNKSSNQASHAHHHGSEVLSESEPTRKPYEDNLQRLYKLPAGIASQNALGAIKMIHKLLDSANEQMNIVNVTKSYFSGDNLFLILGECLAAYLLPDASEEECFKKFTEGGSTILELTSPEEQHRFYSNVFSKHSENVHKEEAEALLDVAFKVAVITSGLSLCQDASGNISSSLIKSLYQGKEDSGCTADHISSWCCKHCPLLLSALHMWTVNSLKGCQPSQHQVASEYLPEDVTTILNSSCLLTLPVLWALTSSLPKTYLPTDITQEGAGPSVASTMSHPLASYIENGGWSLLYNSNSQGLSLNRFQHHVLDYKGPTVTLILFDQNVYCVAADTEWREGTQRWGDIDCKIIQILPQYRIVQDGAGIFYLNTQSRNVPKGFQFGKDPKTLVLQIDEGMSKVKHYGIEIPLHRVEVWGCSSANTRNKQLQQKKWENQQVQKERQRKLKLEDWKDNPDRHLLDMGGVQTEHAQR